MPKVSVCIPTYNTARYLPAAIESVLGQEFSDYELVICDNASTDATPEICRRYGDPRLRYVRFDELVGQAANWNRCLALACGEYVVLLHADDVLLSPFLRHAAAVADAHPTVGLVHCCVQHIDPGGAPLQLQKLYDVDRIEPGDVLLRRLLLEGCVVNPAGVLVRRALYQIVGPFTEEIVWGVDWHMWMRIALQAWVAYVAEPLALYREHPQSGTSGVLATARNGRDETWMREDLFRRIPASRPDLHALHGQARRRSAHRTWCFAEEMCRLGFMPAARAGIRRAVAMHPPMLFESRVWALWAATFLGYCWFQGMHLWKQRIVPGRTAPN